MPVLDWPVFRTRRCNDVVLPVPDSFAAILEARLSQRAMTRAPLREVVNAVAFATRPRAVMGAETLGRSRRPSPSAGALHPIDVVLMHGASRAFRYAPFTHQLETLRVAEREHLHAFVNDCRQILPEASGTAIVLVGDLDRIAAVYEQPVSLLWRDAGVLLQTLALVATAYRLAFCPLGILGTAVAHALGLPARASGLGVALIGRPADS